MSEPDFSGIEPLRVPEVRRRIAVIERYLALTAPTTADAVRLGEEIGLSRWQLQRLATAWRNHRDPRLIVVGKRGPSKRDYGIAPRAGEIASGIISNADPDGSVAEIAAEIEAACAAEEVVPPSRPTIYNYVRSARAGAPASGPDRVVIGRMWFHLPIEGEPAETMPTLIAAVLLPEGLLVAHRISTDRDAPPSVAEVVAEVAEMRTAGAPPRIMVVDADDRRAADTVMHETGLGAVEGRRQSAQRDLSRALNGRLGPLHALYRRARARPATRKASARFEQPLDAGDVVAAIESAIASHNASRGGRFPSFDICPR